MAFEFELEADLEAPRREEEDLWVIDIGLGYDKDEGVAVVMTVMLIRGDSYLEGKVRNAFDLQFGIRKRSLYYVTTPDFHKEAGRRYIPQQHNKDVLTRILSAAMNLTQEVKPDHLTMETFDANLESKALKKYDDICASLAKAGYEVAESFREWYLRRR
ncbi:MAG: hypothetical protein JO328_08950 [Hyphomicrobiales bacterium]|nr:hypothetical protein [Hyphomicrobiales bacterium]MBV9429685.1 hypothetical protein [Bradyrhizobiaceae bacterium]